MLNDRVKDAIYDKLVNYMIDRDYEPGMISVDDIDMEEISQLVEAIQNDFNLPIESSDELTDLVYDYLGITDLVYDYLDTILSD